MDKLAELVRRGQDSGATLRSYGQWFLQLELGEDCMLNFWGHPSRVFPNFVTGIHNHRRQFTSEVMRGCMVNRRYTVTPNIHSGNYQAFHIRRTLIDGKVTFERLPQVDHVEVTLAETESVPMLASYLILPDDFHSTVVTIPTVTALYFTGKETPIQRFLSPCGETPNTKTTLAKVPWYAQWAAWNRINAFVKLTQ